MHLITQATEARFIQNAGRAESKRSTSGCGCGCQCVSSRAAVYNSSRGPPSKHTDLCSFPLNWLSLKGSAPQANVISALCLSSVPCWARAVLFISPFLRADRHNNLPDECTPSTGAWCGTCAAVHNSYVSRQDQHCARDRHKQMSSAAGYAPDGDQVWTKFEKRGGLQIEELMF